MPAFEGKVFKPGEKVRWKTNEIGMQRLGYANRLSARAGTARSLIQIDGSLIPKRGIGQHAVDTALPLGSDNGFDRSARRLSMPNPANSIPSATL